MSVQDQVDTEPKDEQEPSRRTGTRHWIAAAILVVGVVAGSFAFIYLWRPAILMGTPMKAIEYSVSGETGSPWPGDCKRASDRTLTCWLATSGGSGSGRYTVTVGERGCWKAVKTRSEEGADGVMPDTVNDCLSLWDWIRVRDTQ